MVPPKGVCRFFLTGKGCHYGKNCKFAHSSDTKATSGPAPNFNQSNNERPDTDLRRWQRSVRSSVPSGAREDTIAGILREGREMMDSGSADVIHEVIRALSSEEGLTIVRKVTEIKGTGLAGVLRPFLEILSHPDVVTSLILEQQIGTIYNVLFGVSGQKGESFFREVIAYLSASKGSSLGPERFSKLYASSLSVFKYMVAFNQSAAVSEGIRSLISGFEECGSDLLCDSQPQSLAALEATQSMLELKTRLGFAEKMPEAKDGLESIMTGLAQFHLQQDFPGHLCSTGARHDNDAADIKSIQILPTAEEILSPVSEYLPRKDPSTHHVRGVPGLLDRQFRLLREDTVGQLRDAVAQVQKDNTKGSPKGSNGSQGLRTNVFRDAVVTASFFDKRLGLLHVVEFSQPTKMRNLTDKSRKKAWMESRDLATDACVCLISSENQVAFYSVAERDPDQSDSNGRSNKTRLDKSMLGDTLTSLYNDSQRAAVIVRATDMTPETIRRTLRGQNRYSNIGEPQTLLEFPGVLLASFRYTLQALQEMSRTVDLPFSDLLAPSSLSATLPDRGKPPHYARREGFQFDLSRVAKGSDIKLSPSRPFDLNAFAKASGLDVSQAKAFVHALSSQFALIQGPPGTGKSFVGIQLIRTLLQNRERAKIGPILCVCYTNHALDQILEHLIRKNVRQIVRIGGRSKSPLLEGVNLARLTAAIDKTKSEKRTAWEAHKELEMIVRRALAQLEVLDDAGSVASIRRHLLQNHPSFYNALFGTSEDDEGFRTVRHDSGNVFSDWLKHGSPEAYTRIPTGLRSTDPYQLSHRERQALYRTWVQDMENSAVEEIEDLSDRYQEEQQQLEMCHKETSLRCLRQAQIIGVTTTGLAKNIGLLRKLRSKVLIVEEAGEVMEAHMLPALLPSLEHVISIGDHQQLRPQIANFDLSVENPRGSQYSLDVSLFERLIHPEPGLPRLPYVTLKTQRRMHPLISRLIRNTIYPELDDGGLVSEYPPIKSFRHRLFWWEHQELEDSDESMSKLNSFEVEMTAALAHHIIKQGYRTEQITILTPYLAQLRKLRRRFANVFEITVGERDEADLAAAGMEDETIAQTEIPKAHRVSLGAGLRISTVDNYQGEEADIIIVSLVRSNKAGKIGFLRTKNRINVLLSRARYGMYIIGNALVAKGVPMWNDVIRILKEENAIGKTLPLFCERHPDTDIEITNPHDFARLTPEGGCHRSCDKRLACGHSCINKCHAEHLHNAVICQQPCPRLKETCTHQCPKVCGVKCDEKCQTKVKDIPLRCGHIAAQLKCFQSQALEDVKCQHRVQKEVPGCGHTVDVACCQNVTENFRCPASCGAILPCGHGCMSRCSECNTVDDQGQKHTRHLNCKKLCGRDYSTCSHQCRQVCHGDQPCEPCNQPCEVQCVHSRCNKLCLEPCAPCVETCGWSCEHRGTCPLPCSVPCNRLPCSERCSKTLSCGHQCPSICGEPCPTQRFCQVCANDEVLDTVVDMIMFESYRNTDLSSDPVIIPPCGHMQTVFIFDGMMGMKDFYEYDENDAIVKLIRPSKPFEASAIKNCSTCRGSLRMINRYGRIVKRGLIDEATKRFIVWSNAKFANFESRNHDIQSRLSKTVSDAKFQTALGTKFDSDAASALLNIDLKGTSDKIASQIRTLSETGDRYKDAFQFRKGLGSFVQVVSKKEQPFRRVWDLCRSSDDKYVSLEDVENFESAADSALDTRSHLLARTLLLETDVTILTEFVEIWQRSRAGNLTLRALSIDTSEAREQCIKLRDDGLKRSQPLQQIQALVYFALFTAAEIRCPHDSKQEEELRALALNKIEEASDTLEKNSSTAVLRSSVESARKSLGGVFQSVVTDDEMRAVYAAMATEFRGTGHWYRCPNGHAVSRKKGWSPLDATYSCSSSSRLANAAWPWNWQAAHSVELLLAAKTIDQCRE